MRARIVTDRPTFGTRGEGRTRPSSRQSCRIEPIGKSRAAYNDAQQEAQARRRDRVNNENEYLVIIWEFQVKPSAQLDFEKIYGPAGAWANLFRQSPDYRGTELVCDMDCSGRYLTLDRWTSREALHQFKQAHQSEYEAFDKQCETLTENESLLGEFEYHAPLSVA
jgi:hypothetical protein